MNYEAYLEQHGISQDSIKKFGIHESAGKLIIPIRDNNGYHLFNKYRHLTGDTKFTFDVGSKQSLFNSRVLDNNETIYIAEGEIDCIKLNQEGYSSVTSTNGAGSFNEVWSNLFLNKNVYICLDNDRAGKAGSERIAQNLFGIARQVSIIELPNDTKDVCEFFSKHDNKEFQKLVEAARAWTPRGPVKDNSLSIVSWDEFKEGVFEEPKWIIDRLIPEKGLIAVSGAPESCKSFFTTFLALSVLNKKTLFDQYKVQKVPILIIDQENLPVWIKNRINQLSPSLSSLVPLHLLDYKNKLVDILDDTHFEELTAFIREKKIKLVIIDTLRLIHSKEENSSTELKPVFEKLKELTNHTAVLFIQHHRKSDMFGKRKSGAEEMMGSIFILGSLDSHFTLTRVFSNPDKTIVKVRHAKSRYVKAVKSFEMELEEVEGELKFNYLGEAKDHVYKAQEAREIILEQLDQQELTKKDFIELIVKKGICSKRTLESVLSELLKEKHIDYKSRPYIYFLTRKEVIAK